MYGYIPIMIVQIVLVIVTAVQVNSQELCPSVCECDGDNATCTDLFSDVTNMTQETFHSVVRGLTVFGRSRVEMEEDLFLRWNITSLTFLCLSQNNIMEIWQRAFYSLAKLLELDLSENRIKILDSQTFYYNTHLVRLNLKWNRITELRPSTFENNVRLKYIRLTDNRITSLDPDLFKNNLELENVLMNYNRITYIHPSTFRNNRDLKEVQLSWNNIISVHPETFNHNWELQILYLAGNSISDIHPSTFTNNSELFQLEMNGNIITLINPDTFIHNRKLRYLRLQENNIKEISKSLFCGLQKLNELDLSNNNIGELNPLVFHQTPKLKRLNLAHNMIRSFNLESYFPMNSNSDSSNTTFKLEYLNVSSNRLTTLDLASMNWLIHTRAVTDLTANPWNCDCSVLLEVWRGLKHKLKLHCASPGQLLGKSWDVIEEFCSLVEGPSVVTITLIVTGVLLICAIGGGLILVKVAKRRGNKQKTPEYCNVDVPNASQMPLHLYAEVGAGPSHVTDQSYADIGRMPSYISVQSDVDVGLGSKDAPEYVNVDV